MKWLLKNGRVIDPSRAIDGTFDVFVENGRIARVDRDLPADAAKDAVVIDVPRGWVICPGFIDMHVHLREPGQEHKETIASGTAAAVAGGFTAVACMPNTSPVNDTAGITDFILQKARAAGLARVYPIGAVSRGSNGEQLADIAELRESGCVAVSDDGRPVATALLMRRALEYTGMLGIPVIDHCEDQSLKGDGVANEGFQASSLGLRGIPNLAESIMVQRDIALAGLTRGHVHIAHLSTRESLDAVRVGKDRDVHVTCEVTPHHFTLTDEMLGAPTPYDTNVKMNPPLRGADDRDALLRGLADGAIDAIATDHAPHHYDEKQVEFDVAPFGITGLETAVSLALDRLVHRGVLPIARMIELLTIGPARILGLRGGTLQVGAAADMTLLAPDARVTVRAATMKSKSRNMPFAGWALRGAPAMTFVDGRLLYVNAEIQGADAFMRHVEGAAAGAR